MHGDLATAEKYSKDRLVEDTESQALHANDLEEWASLMQHWELSFRQGHEFDRTDNVEVAEQLRETIGRIISIAVVHEFLSHEETTVINIHEVSNRILAEVRNGKFISDFTVYDSLSLLKQLDLDTVGVPTPELHKKPEAEKRA